MNYKLVPFDKEVMTEKNHYSNLDNNTIKNYFTFEGKSLENGKGFGIEHTITKFTDVILFDEGFWIPLIEYKTIEEVFKNSENNFKSKEDFELHFGYVQNINDCSNKYSEKLLSGYTFWCETYPKFVKIYN